MAASASDPNVDWTGLLGPIYSTGLVGLALLALIFEKGIITRASLERARVAHEELLMSVRSQYEEQISDKDEVIASKDKEIADLKAVNAELQRVTRVDMIPALIHATEAVRAYVAELAKRGGTLG